MAAAAPPAARAVHPAVPAVPPAAPVVPTVGAAAAPTWFAVAPCVRGYCLASVRKGKTNRTGTAMHKHMIRLHANFVLVSETISMGSCYDVDRGRQGGGVGGDPEDAKHTVSLSYSGVFDASRRTRP